MGARETRVTADSTAIQAPVLRQRPLAKMTDGVLYERVSIRLKTLLVLVRAAGGDLCR